MEPKWKYKNQQDTGCHTLPHSSSTRLHSSSYVVGFLRSLNCFENVQSALFINDQMFI